MTPNRRTLLCTSVGVTAALASRANGENPPEQRTPYDVPAINGEFSFETNARAAAAHDFGEIIHRQPRAVLKPNFRADIASLMRWVGDRGFKVAARGQGQSTYGHSLTEDGIVIDITREYWPELNSRFCSSLETTRRSS